MADLEDITDAQIEQARAKLRNFDFLSNAVSPAPLTGMMRDYSPKMADFITRENLANIKWMMNAYMNHLTREFKRKQYKGVSVEVFIGQIVNVLVEIFPELRDEFRAWEEGDGKDYIESYHRWNKEEVRRYE